MTLFQCSIGRSSQTGLTIHSYMYHVNHYSFNFWRNYPPSKMEISHARDRAHRRQEHVRQINLQSNVSYQFVLHPIVTIIKVEWFDFNWNSTKNILQAGEDKYYFLNLVYKEDYKIINSQTCIKRSTLGQTYLLRQVTS